MSLSNAIPGRLLIAAVCVMATQLPAWWIEYRTSASAETLSKFDASLLPMQLAGWIGAETKLDERLVKHVGALSTTNRVYSRDGKEIMVHLAAFPPAMVSLPHPPPLCYTNAGWKITGESWIRSEGQPPIRLLEMELDGVRASVGYWYQLGPYAAGDRDQLRQSLQTLRGQGERWPPLVKVLIHMPSDGTAESAKAPIQEIGGAIFKWVEQES